MKKEIVFIIIILTIASISFVSATIQTFCADNSKPISDQNEIALKNTKNINGLGIGVLQTTEQAFYKKFSAELLVDARRVMLSNQSFSETVNLMTKEYKITFFNVSGTKAQIKLDSSSLTLEKDDIKETQEIFLLLTTIDTTNAENPSVTILIGEKKISLSNTENSAEKITLVNKTYIVELTSASATNAVIAVARCSNAEINLDIISDGINQTQTNQSQNTTKPKTEEERIREENEKNNASTKQVSIAELNAKKKNQTANNSDEAIMKNSNDKQGFFSKIWSWLRNLFR